MKKILFVFPVLYFLGSCNNDDFDLPSCRFGDATQDLSWLRAIIEDREANPTQDMKYCYIEQAILQRKPVFVFADCNPLVNKAALVHDCEGNVLKDEDANEIYAYEADLKDRKIIWKPYDFACEF